MSVPEQNTATCEVFRCQKCNTEQPQREVCTSCGVIFEKYYRALEKRSVQADFMAAAPTHEARTRGKAVILAVLVLVLGSLIWWRLRPQPEAPALTDNGATVSSQNDPNLLHQFVPYVGTVIIKHDRSFMNIKQFEGPTVLDDMGLEQIAAYRKEKVQQYAQLNFFHPGYGPLKPPHNKIYNQISPKIPWVPIVPYYIANPYILLSVTHDGMVAPFGVFLNDVDIVYSAGKITETYAGENAKMWKEFLASDTEKPNVINITMANAWDAGFYYLHLVETQSENVVPATEPDNIGKSTASQSSFYHVGKYQQNNKSPYDARFRITLKDINNPTRLVFKLWRYKPPTVTTTPDLIYEIRVL